MSATQCVLASDSIGVPYSFDRTIRIEGTAILQDTVCATCGQTFTDQMDADSKPLTHTYAEHFATEASV